MKKTSKLDRRQWMTTVGALGVALAFAAPAAQAQAQDWPNKPVRMVIPFAVGGATDLLGRALGNELNKVWKQSVVVENKPGAGGGLAADVITKAPADGYVLMLAAGGMFTVNPHIYQKLTYGPDSFEMITKVASGPMVVTVNAGVPVKSMRELIAYAKANPGKLNFASAGNGSQTHIAGEAFADAAGIDVVHVPYKGEGPGYADLMAGVVSMAVGNINAISPLLKGNRLRALAVTGRERSPLLPDVPTVSEAGLSGFEFTGWFGLVAPAGTPKELVAKIHADVRRAMAEPGMRRYLSEQGMSSALSAPGKMSEEVAGESTRWKALVAKRSITAN